MMLHLNYLDDIKLELDQFNNVTSKLCPSIHFNIMWYTCSQ